jgi:hypothetical protein
MMRIKLAIRTPFGEIEVGGDTASDILNALEALDHEFLAEVNDRVSSLLATQARDNLKDIVDMGRDGPVIVTKNKLSHYESIGLVLYGMKDNQSSSRELKRLLAASGKKVTVPARLHEMRKRGHIFKPREKSPIYKLSTKGVKWIEEEVIPQIKKK